MNQILGFFRGISQQFTPQSEGNSVVYRIPHEVVKGGSDCSFHLCFLDARAGDDGYYVIPYAKACFLTRFTPRADTTYSCTENILPMFGAVFGNKALLVIVEGMPYNYRLNMTIKNGKYFLSLFYNLAAIDLYEDILIRVIPLTAQDASYSGMARTYRKRIAAQRQLVPLVERIKSDPTIAYGTCNMPVIRVRMAWKPVPSPVQQQTPENEPPLHVACTFADVAQLMDEMKEQGIEKAELCLVGWNIKGHDGRWPQMFPVEEALGGEDGLRALIAHAKQLGYRISAHTNSSDAYHIADSWDEGEIIQKKDGSLSANPAPWDTWSGGKMYHLCPKVACEKYLQQNLSKIKALGFEGFHYIDVLSIANPRTCYHPSHPLTARDSARYIQQMLRQTRQEIGGIGSEGGYDFAMAELDFALYIGYNLLSGAPKLADEIIPLWQLVYNGYALSNPSAETVNLPIKPADNRLRFYEFGGIPVMYFFSRFVGEAGFKNWMGDVDLYCATAEQRQESVRQIKAMLDDYRDFAPRRLAFMNEHRKLADGVYETIYSDGWHTVVNYTQADFDLDGRIVPAGDLIQFSTNS